MPLTSIKMVYYSKNIENIYSSFTLKAIIRPDVWSDDRLERETRVNVFNVFTVINHF